MVDVNREGCSHQGMGGDDSVMVDGLQLGDLHKMLSVRASCTPYSQLALGPTGSTLCAQHPLWTFASAPPAGQLHGSRPGTSLIRIVASEECNIPRAMATQLSPALPIGYSPMIGLHRHHPHV